MHITYCFVSTTAMVTRTGHNDKVQCTAYLVYNAFLLDIINLCTFGLNFQLHLSFILEMFRSDLDLELSRDFLQSDRNEWRDEIRHNRFLKNPFKLTKSSHII